MKLIEKYFSYRLKREKIEKYLMNIEPETKTGEKSKKIKAAVVQRTIKPVKSVKDYLENIHAFVKQASEENSDIVAFPEYNFFDLLGLIPGFNIFNNYLNKKAQKEFDKKKANEVVRQDLSYLHALFASVAQPIQQAIEMIMADLAQKYQIYIYSGSYLIKEDDKLYNGGALFSKEGRLIGRQKKLHLTDFEEDIGFSRENNLSVYHIDTAKITFPVCMDATYFETFKIARKKGADIVIIPIANNEEYSVYKALRGIWPRVQESYVYGLKPSLNGWIAGMYFSGKAGIFAPIGISVKNYGVLALAEHYEGDYLITSDMDLDKLDQVRNTSEYYGDINEEFERDYYQKTYEGKFKSL